LEFCPLPSFDIENVESSADNVASTSNSYSSATESKKESHIGGKREAKQEAMD